jgi:hypothetical protein
VFGTSQDRLVFKHQRHRGHDGIPPLERRRQEYSRRTTVTANSRDKDIRIENSAPKHTDIISYAISSLRHERRLFVTLKTDPDPGTVDIVKAALINPGLVSYPAGLGATWKRE